MKPFYLSEITTKDGLVHQGIFCAPMGPAFAKATAGKAILWVHGLTSNFYGDNAIFQELLVHCEEKNMGFAAFNNRGHDFLSGIRKIDSSNEKGYAHVTQGAGYEIFEECVYDIDAGVTYLTGQEFSEIILVGHSTGANKVCFYAATQTDARVSAVVLASPLSDRLGAQDKKAVGENRKFMQSLDDSGRGDALVMGRMFFPLTPKRYLSLFSPHSNEDVFDYGDEKPEMTHFSLIQKPTCVIFGGSDEYVDRPISDIQRVFDARTKSKNYSSFIIDSANHGFDGKEKEFAGVIFNWISSI